jgi:hypothetical protein
VSNLTRDSGEFKSLTRDVAKWTTPQSHDSNGADAYALQHARIKSFQIGDKCMNIKTLREDGIGARGGIRTAPDNPQSLESQRNQRHPKSQLDDLERQERLDGTLHGTLEPLNILSNPLPPDPQRKPPLTLADRCFLLSCCAISAAAVITLIWRLSQL